MRPSHCASFDKVGYLIQVKLIFDARSVGSRSTTWFDTLSKCQAYALLALKFNLSPTMNATNASARVAVVCPLLPHLVPPSSFPSTHIKGRTSVVVSCHVDCSAMTRQSERASTFHHFHASHLRPLSFRIHTCVTSSIDSAIVSFLLLFSTHRKTNCD